jgi:predicted nucleotidyltransferase
MVDIEKQIAFWRDGECLPHRRPISGIPDETTHEGRGAELHGPRRRGFSMVNESVLNGVRKYLRALRDQGVAVKFGVVFGSHVAGKADIWSDVDLLVVSPRFDDQRSREDINLLWRRAAKTDNRIEPIPCGERQWHEDDASAIIEIARREGEAVTIS